jgi:hypothetical protein
MYYEIISIAYGSAADSDAGPRLLNDGKGSLRSDVLAPDFQFQCAPSSATNFS